MARQTLKLPDIVEGGRWFGKSEERDIRPVPEREQRSRNYDLAMLWPKKPDFVLSASRKSPYVYGLARRGLNSHTTGQFDYRRYYHNLHVLLEL